MHSTIAVSHVQLKSKLKSKSRPPIPEFSGAHSNNYLYTLLVCLFVPLYPVSVETAEPVEAKICEATHMTQGKV